MLRAQIEYHAQAGTIGLNFIDDYGVNVWRQSLWCEADDCCEIYHQLARLNSAEGVLENYEWAIRVLDFAKQDCLLYLEINQMIHDTEKQIPKESSVSMFDRIMRKILGPPQEELGDAT